MTDESADNETMETQPQVKSSAFVEGVGEIAKNGQHNILVVDSDPRWATAVENRVNAHPRFEVVAVTGMVAHAVDLLERFRPSAVMLAAELTGTSGLDAIPIFRRIAPGCEIILLSQGSNARELASQFGAFGSVSKFRAAQEFDGVINRLATFLDQPPTDAKQRRTGEDRRKKQDWNKVTSERRNTERRVEDSGFIPSDSDALPPDKWGHGDGSTAPEKGFY